MPVGHALLECNFNLILVRLQLYVAIPLALKRLILIIKIGTGRILLHAWPDCQKSNPHKSNESIRQRCVRVRTLCSLARPRCAHMHSQSLYHQSSSDLGPRYYNKDAPTRDWHCTYCACYLYTSTVPLLQRAMHLLS